MIKQNWNINSEEKLRILNLHESATKNLYLIQEQVSGETSSQKSWQLCSSTIFESGGKYYTQLKNGQTIEIPKLSEVSGTVQGGRLVLSQLTQNGLTVGEEMKSSIACQNDYPMVHQGNIHWFCYFDDISRGLVGNRGSEKLVNKNVPMYGVLAWDGSLGTGSGDYIDTEIQKDRNGVVVQFAVSRSKSYLFEVSPALQGSPYVQVAQPAKTETKPKTETFDLNIQSPFVFDKTDLTPEAQQQFNQFIENIKKNYQGVTGNVDVITSASIDADPAAKEKYNMDLSTRRANDIIQKLKTALGQTSLTFVPKPIGQTDQFAPGVKWPDVKNTEQTAPNRRLIIKLPQITRQVK